MVDFAFARSVDGAVARIGWADGILSSSPAATTAKNGFGDSETLRFDDEQPGHDLPSAAIDELGLHPPAVVGVAAVIAF